MRASIRPGAIHPRAEAQNLDGGSGLSAAFVPWRNPLAKQAPAKVLLDLAISIALGGRRAATPRCCAPSRASMASWLRTRGFAHHRETLAADVEKVSRAVAADLKAAHAHVWGHAGPGRAWEPLWMKLPPGNSGSNTVDDQIDVARQPLKAVPRSIPTGPCAGPPVSRWSLEKSRLTATTTT